MLRINYQLESYCRYLPLGDGNGDYECLVSSDCDSGYHCFDRECLSNSVANVFPDCIDQVCDGTTCTYNVCNQSCANCEDGKMGCLQSTTDNPMHLKCVECFIDSQCATGYVCEIYLCVAE